MSRVALVLAACSLACAHSSAVRAPAPRATAPAVLPAGMWAFGPSDDGACIDCSTPRAVVVLARGSVETLARATPAELAPGYPLIVEGARVGDGSAFVLVGAILGSAEDARAWIAARGEVGATVAAIAPGEPEQVVVRVTRDVEAFARADLELLVAGAEPTPRCDAAAGRLEVVRTTDLVRAPDAWTFVPVRCVDGSIAHVVASATDLGLTTFAREGGGRVELQEAGRVCGSVTYEERALGGDGTPAVVRTLETERCFGQPAGIDAWSICTGGDLHACVARSVALRPVDPEHARRLAAYACRQGLASGCIESIAAMEALGASAEARLGEASLRCGGDDDVCAELDRLYRAIDPAAIEGDPGSFAYEGCDRGHEAWCAALSRSEVCDADGCG